MKCKKCGNENEKNSVVCKYCGARLDDTINKKMPTSSKIIIASIAVLSVILVACLSIGTYSYIKNKNRRVHYGGGGGSFTYTTASDGSNGIVSDPQVVMSNMAEINGGEAPQIYCNDDNIPIFIDGKYSNVIVTDFTSAIRSLNDIAGIMQITQPMEEFVGKDSYTLDNQYKFYKLKQVVNGIIVYGRELIVETDLNGNILSLSCEYVPGISVEATQTISKDEAIQKAKEAYTQYTKIYDANKYVYELTLETPVVCWAVDMGYDEQAEERVFISANDGSVVWFESFEKTDSVQSTGVDMNGVTRSFNTEKMNDGSYVMFDKENILTAFNWNDGNSNEAVTSSDPNVWDSREAVSAYSNLGEIISFYKNNLYTAAFNGNKLERIILVVNYRPYTSSEPYDNAFSYTPSDETTYLCFGNAREYAKVFDVAAHEFTHSVVSATCDLNYMNQSGAINEAYADIIGNCMENVVHSETLNGYNEWILGEEVNINRDLQNPNNSNQPETVNGRYMAAYCYNNNKNHDHATTCDNGGVHTNSGIINKAAYLMYSKGINDKYQLMSLFSRSMDYMVSSSDFRSCRLAIMRSGKDMGFDEAKINAIAEAFDEVGIELKNYVPVSFVTSNGRISGKVADSGTNEPIREAVITVKKISNSRVSDVQTSTAYTDENGNFNVEVALATSLNAADLLNSNSATYMLFIGAAGYDDCTVGNIVVRAGETTYLENTILLKNTGGSSVAQLGGVVTNAVSGDVVEGVQIKFRKNYGTSEGDYVYNNGSVIVLNTDSEGKYYTSKLSRNYYTAEVTKEGYVTQYVNVFASNDENALNQNIVLSPIASGDEFRITLEWDADPRDEDSHIEGSLPDGDSFHVYYANKNKKVDGEVVANLDHDDTQGNGFETVTLKVQSGGSYKYYVHHFAGNGNLSTSNAKVKVYRGNEMVKKYNVPIDGGTGIYWNVFKIENGEIVDVNRISEQVDF